jgi:FKBP-type peptidyl-prolyl cis-trans isomerase
LKDGEDFLATNFKKEGVHTTISGLQYEVVQEGEGEKPGAAAQVTVHYHGTLLDGTIFDSSIQRGQPATFGVNQVIPGWTEALQLMKKGAKYRLYIPQNLAYGANPHPSGAIKPYMALIFDVELLEIA